MTFTIGRERKVFRASELSDKSSRGSAPENCTKIINIFKTKQKTSWVWKCLSENSFVFDDFEFLRLIAQLKLILRGRKNKRRSFIWNETIFRCIRLDVTKIHLQWFFLITRLSRFDILAKGTKINQIVKRFSSITRSAQRILLCSITNATYCGELYL